MDLEKDIISYFAIIMRTDAASLSRDTDISGLQSLHLVAVTSRLETGNNITVPLRSIQYAKTIGEVVDIVADIAK